MERANKIWLETNLCSGLEELQFEKIQKGADHLLFLSQVSRWLCSALKDRSCFQTLLSQLIPSFADYGTLTLVDDYGNIQRTATAHADETKIERLRSIQNNLQPSIEDQVGPGRVILTKESELVEDCILNDVALSEKIAYPELEALLHEFETLSILCVPIKFEDQAYGAITLATTRLSNRRYQKEDLRLAEEIACRVGNAAFHLFRYERATQAIQQLKTECQMREDYFSQVRHDVLSALSAAKLFAQLLESGRPTEVGHCALKMIRAVDKVAQILEVSE